MHRITIYACDICGAEHREESAAMEHEASHFGLSGPLYGEWHGLRRAAARASARTGQTSNPETRAAFDAAVRKLVDFEDAHGLAGKTQPLPA